MLNEPVQVATVAVAPRDRGLGPAPHLRCPPLPRGGPTGSLSSSPVFHGPHMGSCLWPPGPSAAAPGLPVQAALWLLARPWALLGSVAIQGWDGGPEPLTPCFRLALLLPRLLQGCLVLGSGCPAPSGSPCPPHPALPLCSAQLHPGQPCSAPLSAVRSHSTLQDPAPPIPRPSALLHPTQLSPTPLPPAQPDSAPLTPQPCTSPLCPAGQGSYTQALAQLPWGLDSAVLYPDP